MADLNQVALVGRLVRDAELAYTASGMAACKFSLAVNKNRKAGDKWENDAHFFDFVLWGKRGESISKYLAKGKQIAVTGELTQERWKSNEQNRSKVVITVDDIQLLIGNSGGENKELFPPASDAPPSDATNGSYTDDIPF